jgi:D-xylonolactonase
MPDWIGWLLPWRDGIWVAGLRGGIVTLRLEPAVRIDWLWRLHEEASPLRVNDAKIDPAGRLWFGTMHDRDSNNLDGLLRCVGDEAELVVADRGYRIANGPAFCPDGKTIWHSDSAKRCVYAFDLGPRGRLSLKRVWLRVMGSLDKYGYPDGMTVDANRHLWIARWDAGCVTEHDEDAIEVRRFHVPAAQTTSLAFGGNELRDLYITSAWIGMVELQRARHPFAGGLFRIRDTGPGLQAPSWRPP